MKCTREGFIRLLFIWITYQGAVAGDYLIYSSDNRFISESLSDKNVTYSHSDASTVIQHTLDALEGEGGALS